MAKYVYHVPAEGHGCGQMMGRAAAWSELAHAFGLHLQKFLVRKFGLHTCVFPEEAGVELAEGCAGMGKDWFSFRFRVFADLAVYLDMINVPFEWRHRGIGKWLVAELKRFAAENSLKYILLGSYEPANPFWESCGFVRITEYPDFVLGEDSMAK